METITLYDFIYFLIHIRPFDVISNYSKTNLPDIYMLKVDNKNNRTRCETYLELKLKNKYTITVFIVNRCSVVFDVALSGS